MHSLEAAFPLAGELDSEHIVERLGLTGRARVQSLGASGNGQPIELISIGDGDHSALIIGGPHPNEPIGCLTALLLLSRLSAEGALADAPGWQWHVIPAIDIDGIVLNQNWFHGPLTVERYLRHFYRPPFPLQPEYSFPLEIPGYHFRAETAESACWRKALELTRPDLQCSLHGADTGGSFFIVSGDTPALTEQLAGLPARFGIALNPIGEPFTGMTGYQPGVLSFPPVEDFAARSTADGPAWNAGDSSAGYAAKRFGTFSMTCEVPLWHDPRELSAEPSGYTMTDVIDERVAQLREDEQLLSRHLPALAGSVDSFESIALSAALDDSLVRTPGTIAMLEDARGEAPRDAVLSLQDLARLESGTTGLRTPAMLTRLARLTRPAGHDGATAAADLVHRRLAVLAGKTRLTSVAPQSAAGLQIGAIVQAARVIGAAPNGL